MSGPRLAICAPLKAWGGIEGKLVTLCREFLAAGVHVQLLLARGGVVPYPDRFPAGVEVIDLESGGKLDTARKLARFLRQDPPDALFTTKDHAIKAAVLGRALACSSVPLYYMVNTAPSQTLRRPVKRWMARWFYPRADGVITVSADGRDDLLAGFSVDPARVTVIYNPVITPEFPERSRAPVDHPWLSGDGPPVLMGVGRLAHQKDFPTLLEGFARLRQQRRVRLIILGEGPLREELEERASALGISEDVDLHGAVPDALPWLARANLFVLSSRYEGLPNVLVEALAVGAPAVSTDCLSGPREILEEGRLGPLVPVGDAAALAEAMASTIDQPPPHEVLATSLERFKSGPVARRYLEFMGLLESC